ncbi:MAG: PHP domain-containing protein [Candidatus Cloacimonetes bacterium]|nr:PHP domain-containing protein [Candidatus Cloacimonadota bacterium]
MKLDLHTHTTVSDGSFSPTEILKKAAELELEYFSITDHDSIDALDQISEIPPNMKFINGVEISAEFPKTLHILGYDFDPKNEKLRKALKELQDFRKNRNAKMLQKLSENGFPISQEELEIEAKGEIVGRPHFANLMHKKGYVNSYQEAFDLYLDKGKPFYMNKKRLDPKLAIELILQAGGIPVIAHPYQTKLSDEDLENLIKELKNYDLMGIEAYYSQHTKDQVNQYLEYAEKCDLLITAGSDFHGTNKSHIPLGMDVSKEHLNRFLDKLK